MAGSVVDRYQLDAGRISLEAARQFCGDVCRQNTENFTVVSWFLPRRLRQPFADIYAYCRIADDLGDEIDDTDASLMTLRDWRAQLDDCYASRPRHPVFVALRETITEFDLPREPFDRLLDAFERDRRQTRYETYRDLLSYCACSANPVGHLVLYLGGYRDAERQELADHTCTALQLTNFWQDVARDFAKGRIYLPAEDRERFGVTEEQLAAGRCDDAYRELLRFEVERTRALFLAGRPLLELLNGHLRRDVALFSAGGWRILDKIAALGYDTLSTRPALGRAEKAGLMLRTLLGGRSPWA